MNPPRGGGFVNCRGLYQVEEAAVGTLNLNRTVIAAIPAEAESFAYDPTGNCRPPASDDLRRGFAIFQPRSAAKQWTHYSVAEDGTETLYQPTDRRGREMDNGAAVARRADFASAIHFSLPDVTMTPEGELVVADAYNYSIQWLSTDGTPIRRVGRHLLWLWPRPATGEAGFNVPSSEFRAASPWPQTDSSSWPTAPMTASSCSRRTALM